MRLLFRTRHFSSSQFAPHKYTPSSFPGPSLRENELEASFLSQLDLGGNFQLPPNPDGLTFAGLGLDKQKATLLIKSMFMTRVAHNVSRRAALEGKTFYSIGPGGHESVAAVALALRKTDPALLHYRDTAFQVMRGLDANDSDDVLRDLMRSYVVSSLDPTTGGRHKALGSLELNIIPTTSTIASHFPRGVALAASVPLVRKLKVPSVYPSDSVVITSGGDATINHATFQTAENYLKFVHLGLGMKIPSLILIADNGIGISVRTPKGWVELSLKQSGLPYFKADGSNILDTFRAATDAVESARSGKPTFLHIECPRLFNHAGSDAGHYQTASEISDFIARDPLPVTAGLALHEGLFTAKELKAIYMELHLQAEDLLNQVCQEPKLDTVESIMAAIVPTNSSNALPPLPQAAPTRGNADAGHKPLILKQQINRVLAESMERDPTVVLVGEDIGLKGGNYGVTDGLMRKFGPQRVRDSFLDETSILGMAAGFSLNGLVPIVEICYLAYIHNAIDQIRGEAATLSFFSNGQYSNGMIVRTSGGGLTEFGGHFHNENSLAPLLDIPGLLVLYPSNGPDYVKLFRTAHKLARQGRVVVIIEPIKAYALRNFGPNNTSWAFPYPDANLELELGAVREYGSGKELAIVSYGNGVRLSIQAMQMLEERHGIHATVLERPCLRGHADHQLEERLRDFAHIVFADESRFQGCPLAELISTMTTNPRFNNNQKLGLVTAANSYLPLGPAANTPGLYLGEASIVAEALRLLGA